MLRVDQTEGEIQHDIIELLRVAFPLAWFERCNTGMVRKNGRVIRFGLGKGCADVIGCMLGMMIAIEVKKPGKPLDPDQIRWWARHESAGGVYILAHSPQEAVELLKLSVAKRRAT